MKRIKFLHCADIHLDAPFTSLGSSVEKSAERRQELKAVLERIVNIARVEEVDLLIISGDLYEHGYVRKSTINYINDLFAKIPEVDVFLLPGNHDPFISNSYYLSFRWSSNVHIISRDNNPVFLEDKDACIYGIGFEDFSGSRPEMHLVKPMDKSSINILLAHGTIDMNIGKDSYNPMKSVELGVLGMDYVALGHFHNRLEDIGGIGVLYNPGCPEPMGFDETGEHGVFIGAIEKEDDLTRKLQIKFVKTNRRTYENISVRVDGCCTNEQIIDRISCALPEQGLQDMLISVVLEGYASYDMTVDVPLIEGFFKDKIFFIKVKDETLPDYDFKALERETGLKGLFVRKLLGKIEKESDESRKRLLMRSLYYGLEALDRGEVNVG